MGYLVVRGEAGIGKSALLDAAAETAGDLLVLRAHGVESEVDIAFSGLHELLRPTLASLAAVPDSQAGALRAALALDAPTDGDRLAVYGGALSLLAAAAEDRPLLCIIDDAHWLDDASAAAITSRPAGWRRIASRSSSVSENRRLGRRLVGTTRAPPGWARRGSARQLLASRLPTGSIGARRRSNCSRSLSATRWCCSSSRTD